MEVQKKIVTEKQKALLSTKKAKGLVAKVSQMILEDQYCPGIIQQIDASVGLLNSVKKILLTGHIEHCLAYNMKENKEQAINELLKIYNLGKKHNV
jgi:CsoR family transcriptional regulator, copper-sensing transcriptional repressor